MKTAMLTVILLIDLIVFVDNIKIKDRYWTFQSGYEFKVLIAGTTDMYKVAGIHENFFRNLLPRLNLTPASMLEAGVEIEIGHHVPDPKNKSACKYSGMIGGVQRMEFNFFTQFARLDQFGCAPGHFVVFSEISSSPKIFSAKTRRPVAMFVDILYLAHNFAASVWAYFATSLTMASIVFVMIKLVINRCFQDSEEPTSIRSTSIKDMVKLFVVTYWNYFMTFLDLAPTTILTQSITSAFILWTSICIAVYYAIHLVLMGTLSTDLVVAINPRSIETLNDLLYDPEFNETRPIVLKQFNMYDALMATRNGTLERDYINKVLLDANRSIYEFEVSDDVSKGSSMLTPMLELIGNVTSGQVAVIENHEIMRIAFRGGGCYLPEVGKLIENLTVSTKTVIPSPLTSLVSFDTSPAVRHYFMTRVRVIQESKLLMGTLAHMAPVVMERMGIRESINQSICESKFDGMLYVEQDFPWNKLDMSPFRRLVNICCSIFVGSFVVLVLELLRWYEQSFFEAPHDRIDSRVRSY